MTLNSFCSSSQLTTLLPERSLLKGNLSGSTLLATILGQEKFSVNNKRQNIEQGRDVGPRSSRSSKNNGSDDRV